MKPNEMVKRKIGIVFIGILCISIPVILAIYQSTKQSLRGTQNLLLAYAEDVMYRADKTGKQIYHSISTLEANKYEPCSANYINMMISLDMTSSNIQAIGYAENNLLKCSSLMGGKQLNWNLGPVDLVTSKGVSIRFNVKLPNSDTSFLVIEKDHYAAIIHKDIALETAIFHKEISLGIFSLDTPHIYVGRNFINNKWFEKMGNKNQVTFLQEGYAVALVKSKKYQIGAVAAEPFSYLNQNTIKAALILVPVSALAGIILTYLIYYWMRQRISLEALLKAALKRREFYLVYQPIFDVKTNLCVGAEALMRWKHISGEIIPPDEFIPLAEKKGLMQQVTNLLFELVAEDAKGLFKTYPHFHLALNVSAEDLHSNDMVARLQTLMHKTNAGPQNLIIEATEREILDLDLLIQTIASIHDLGIKVAIDDFGTGYSNLSYLEKLKLDYLKIDKSFVNAVGTDSSTSQVILHIIDMAKALNLQIIAEGVEHEEQREFIRNNDVQFVQGWLYSKPIPLNSIKETLLFQHKN